MKRILPLIFLLFLVAPLCGQNLQLMAALIPDTLQADANAVIRFHKTEIMRLSENKARMKVHYAVTILNKKGAGEARLYVFYSSKRKVKSIDGWFYNGLGLQVDKVEKDDINDYASYADYTFFSDSRVKTIRPVRNQYPYTVEYEYELLLEDLVGFDLWMPVNSSGVSLEQADLIFHSEASLPVRYKAENAKFDFKELVAENNISFHWKLETFPAYENVPFMLPKRDFLPYVMLAPENFEYSGTSGNFDSWKNYGLWVNELLMDRAELPEETQEKILILVSDDDSKVATIEKIYNYVQQNTRYINISKGIGGFQPMKAEDVDETGYGDCKALSNYTMALLKVAGIESFYAEIGNGKERAEMFPDFTSVNQTNHVILCVPVDKDTIWLECTNQNIPCGYIGDGNCNRKALLMTGEGGKLVNTPKYEALDNLTQTTVKASIDEDGHLTCDVSFENFGLACSQLLYPLHSSSTEQKKWLLSQIETDGITIEHFEFSDNSTMESCQNKLELKLTSKDYAVKLGKRMLIEPNIFNTYISGIIHNPTRNFDLHVTNGYTEIDSIRLKLPESYSVDYLPETVTASCPLGTFEMHCDTIAGNLQYVRTLVVNRGSFSTDIYEEIYGFFKTIAESDEKSVVLIKDE